MARESEENMKIKEKLASARTLLPGMSEDFYRLTDYMAENANEELVPMGIVMLSVCVRDDLEKGRNGFGRSFPEELVNRRWGVKAQIQWIPQLIDAIADEEFAVEVRQWWEIIFGSVPPKRVDTTVETEVTETYPYPQYVKMAVDWWANAILAAEYNSSKMKNFKEALAKGIMDEMSMYGRCNIDVDYYPCEILASAGNHLIGLEDNMTGYPWKTYMWISETEVSVRSGYGAPIEVIWNSP